MKRVVLWTMGFVALSAGFVGRAHADEKKADEKFCAAAAAYQSDIAELKATGEHSTVAEVRAARRRIDAHVHDMTTAAARMKTPAAKTFLAATHKLDKDIDSVSDDATLKQVSDTIRADVKEAKAAAEQVAAEAGCPQTEMEPEPPAPEPPAPQP